MKIGNQSTLNDLSDLKTDLEQKIEEAKAVKVGQVAQIESANIETGSVYDHRPSGVYNIRQGASKPAGSTGVMVHFSDPDPTFMAGLYVDINASDLYVLTEIATTKTARKILSTSNTITDANGFIKTA